jgi:lysophospholipase L1-like esterase
MIAARLSSALLLVPLLVALAGCAAARPYAGHSPSRTIAKTRAAEPARATDYTSTYVAIGASDTSGYGVPDPATQGWVPQFAAMLPAGTRLVNLGVNGLTLHRALRVDLPVALDAHPDLVTVWLAVNDLLDGVPLAAYRADLHTLLSGLREAGARVLVGNLPDLSLVPAAAARLGADPAGTIAAWNAAIAAEAQATGATVVDLHGSWQELAAHPEYVGPDGLHPSVAGYARLAQVFASAL